MPPDDPSDREAAPRGSGGPEHGAWTVEDFDDFAPFDDAAVTSAGSESEDDAGQRTLDFAPVDDEHSSPEESSAGSDASLDPFSIDASTEDNPGEDDPVEQHAADDPVEEDPVEEDPVEEDPVEEDTVEAVFEGGEAGTADFVDDESAVAVPEFASFTSEDYVQTTTQEFVDLASDVARASAEEHVPSAVAAEIPGLETGLVGLDDVVAATGEDPAAIPARKKSDLGLRVFTGLGLAVIFFASLYAPLLVGTFVLLILLTAAVEYFATLARSGYRPLGLFGLLGTVGALVGTWVWGPIAIPISIAATLVVTLLFLGIVAGKRGTLVNVALTVLGTAWIGGLGGFIFDMVRAELYGWLIVATVVTVAIMDVAQYFFGRRLGWHRLAPRISPNKTVEGLVGGVLVALLVGVTFGLLSGKVGFLELNSPIDLGAGVAIGLVVAAAAPFGDLAVSLLKRSVGVKDMGTVLPGHGGLLDRVDAMLLAIPLTWIVFAWTGLLA